MKMSLCDCIIAANELSKIIDYKELTKYLLKKIEEKKEICGEDDISIERIALILCARLAFKEYDELVEKEDYDEFDV